jgi:hypothetical protein
MKCTHFWITFKLQDRGDDRYISCIHKNDTELFFNAWHQLTKFSETGWPRSACNFMFPLRCRRNAIHMCTLENYVIHVHCKRSFLVGMVYFNWYRSNFLLMDNWSRILSGKPFNTFSMARLKTLQHRLTLTPLFTCHACIFFSIFHHFFSWSVIGVVRVSSAVVFLLFSWPSIYVVILIHRDLWNFQKWQIDADEMQYICAH